MFAEGSMQFESWLRIARGTTEALFTAVSVLESCDK